MIKKKIKIPYYFHSLTIIQTNNFKKIEKKYNLDSLGDYEGVVFDNKSDIYVVLRKNTTPSIIAHEVIHIVNLIFNSVGIKLDPNNDEAYAYTVGWIIKKIHKVVKVK